MSNTALKSQYLASEKVAIDDAAKDAMTKAGQSFLKDYDVRGVDGIVSKMTDSAGKGYLNRFFVDLKKLSPSDQKNSLLAVKNGLVTQMLDSPSPLDYLNKNSSAFIKVFGINEYNNLNALADVSRLSKTLDISKLNFSKAATEQESASQALANVVPAFIHANAAFLFANTANVHLNVAFRHANAAFSNANNAVYRTGGSDIQTINGNINVTGKLESGNIKFNGGTALLQGGTFVFNGNQNQNQSPSLSATIEVDRGVSPNAIFRYNETIDRWQYTHATSDPADFTTLGFVSDRANNITGGAASRIVYQSEQDTTAFIVAPPANLNRFLNWTGTGFSWSEISAPNLTGYIQVDAAGLLPTNRVSRTDTGGARTYPMNITGDAGYATSAGSATSASSATTAGSTTNVTSGGTIVTGVAGQATSANLTNYGASDLYGRVRIRNSTQATTGQDNSTSPAAGASLYVEGGIFCEKDIVADFFRGIATSAYYSADLAECYLPDQSYDYGTIMMIGGNKEVTAATKDKLHVIIGVVSEKPAFLMNDGLEGGIVVGLKGRLPVRILGTCKKGDLLEMSDVPGVAKVSDGNKLPLRLICLEDKNTEEEGKIEVAIM